MPNTQRPVSNASAMNIMQIMMLVKVDLDQLTKWAHVFQTCCVIVLTSNVVSPQLAVWKKDIKCGYAKLKTMSEHSIGGTIFLAKIMLFGAIKEKFPDFTEAQAVTLTNGLKRASGKGESHYTTTNREIISELRKRCPGADETSALNKAKGDWITWIGASALDEASIKALVGLFDKPATNCDNPPPTLAKTYEFGPDNFSAESLYDMIPECYRKIKKGAAVYCALLHHADNVAAIPSLLAETNPIMANEPIVAAAPVAAAAAAHVPEIDAVIVSNGSAGNPAININESDPGPLASNANPIVTSNPIMAAAPAAAHVLLTDINAANMLGLGDSNAGTSNAGTSNAGTSNALVVSNRAGKQTITVVNMLSNLGAEQTEPPLLPGQSCPVVLKPPKRTSTGGPVIKPPDSDLSPGETLELKDLAQKLKAGRAGRAVTKDDQPVTKADLKRATEQLTDDMKETIKDAGAALGSLFKEGQARTTKQAEDAHKKTRNVVREEAIKTRESVDEVGKNVKGLSERLKESDEILEGLRDDQEAIEEARLAREEKDFADRKERDEKALTERKEKAARKKEIREREKNQKQLDNDRQELVLAKGLQEQTDTIAKGLQEQTDTIAKGLQEHQDTLEDIKDTLGEKEQPEGNLANAVGVVFGKLLGANIDNQSKQAVFKAAPPQTPSSRQPTRSSSAKMREQVTRASKN